MSIVRADSGNESQYQEILQPVQSVYDFVEYAVTVVAGLILIFAGYTFITSGNDPRKERAGKEYGNVHYHRTCDNLGSTTNCEANTGNLNKRLRGNETNIVYFVSCCSFYSFLFASLNLVPVNGS